MPHLRRTDSEMACTKDEARRAAGFCPDRGNGSGLAGRFRDQRIGHHQGAGTLAVHIEAPGHAE